MWNFMFTEVWSFFLEIIFQKNLNFNYFVFTLLMRQFDIITLCIVN